MMELQLVEQISNDKNILQKFATSTFGEITLHGRTFQNYSVPKIIHYQHSDLPKLDNHHISLLQTINIETQNAMIWRLLKFLQRTPLNKHQIYHCLQYHPLYHQIISQFNNIESNLIHKKILPERLCFDILSGRFVPLKIRETILSKYLHQQTVIFEVPIPSKSLNKAVKVVLTIVSKQPYTSNELLKVIEKISKILQTVYSLYNDKISHNINNNLILYFYPTNFKKQLPKQASCHKINTFLKQEAQLLQKEGYCINPNNYQTTTSVAEVNSALCFLSPIKNDRYMVIWRKEDWTNRLLHELVHYYDLEKVKLPSLYKVKENSGFSINNQVPVNPNELVTEIQTFYLWLVYLAYTYDYDEQAIFQRLTRECKHIIRKAKLLLRHYDVNTVNQLTVGDKVININSNAFYYYILRGLAVCYLDAAIFYLAVPNLTVTNDEIINSLRNKLRLFDACVPNGLLSNHRVMAPQRDVNLKFYLPE